MPGCGGRRRDGGRREGPSRYRAKEKGAAELTGFVPDTHRNMERLLDG